MIDRERLAPAMGERRAIGGYHPQYRVAAGLILRALRDGTLDWTRVADPEAGHVDDFRIATPNGLDAYQVKWSRFPQTLKRSRKMRPGAMGLTRTARPSDANISTYAESSHLIECVQCEIVIAMKVLI